MKSWENLFENINKSSSQNNCFIQNKVIQKSSSGNRRKKIALAEEKKLQLEREDRKLQLEAEDGKLQLGAEDGKLQLEAKYGKLQLEAEYGKLQVQDIKLQLKKKKVEQGKNKIVTTRQEGDPHERENHCSKVQKR